MTSSVETQRARKVCFNIVLLLIIPDMFQLYCLFYFKLSPHPNICLQKTCIQPTLRTYTLRQITCLNKT
jgi:hypothetical protein